MSENLADAVARAHDEIARLCKPGERWRMSIPASPFRDSDLILSDALDALVEALAFVEALADEWDGDEGRTIWHNAAADLRAVLGSDAHTEQHTTQEDK